jgi:hypothetical protein
MIDHVPLITHITLALSTVTPLPSHCYKNADNNRSINQGYVGTVGRDGRLY